jgi:hypothetical protein
VPAEQNERGNIPAHNKNTNGHSHNSKTDGSNITQIFWRQEQSISTETFHKHAVHHTKHDEPKDQQYLVFSEMQKDELNG